MLIYDLLSARSLFLYYQPVLHGLCWPVVSEVIISILHTCSPQSLLTCRQRGHYFYITNLFSAVLADLSSVRSLFLYYPPVLQGPCWPVVSEVIISILHTCFPDLSSVRSLFLYYPPVPSSPCWPVVSEVIISISPTCSQQSLLTCRQRGHYFYITHLFSAVLADLSLVRSLFLYYLLVLRGLCWPVISEVIISILPTCSPRSLLTCH